MKAARPGRPEASRRSPRQPNPSGGLQAVPSRALSALFGLCLLGVLLMGGLLAAQLGGMVGLVGYAAVTGLALGLGIARVRRLVAASAPPPRPACACCDGDHLKPIEVV